jgi:peptide/nickel transport system permease protein
MTTWRPDRLGALLLVLIAVIALSAGALAPNDPTRQFPDYEYAPPMRPHVVDDDGAWHWPFAYPVRLVDRLERRYVEDRSRRIPLAFRPGLRAADDSAGPWLLLGGDDVGRDVFARLLGGARLSLGLAVFAAAGALGLGSFVGALSGFAGGRLDELLMRTADFVMVLPAVYVVLALRSVMPLVLSTTRVFWTMAGVLALAGWPYCARGVRAIVAAERRKEYAESAMAAGAGRMRILLRHLLPATRGFLAVQGTLLLPAFILAEATLSFVGLGFAEPTASWGLMLHAAARTSALSDAPWLLAPAAAIVISVLAVHLAVADRSAIGPGASL